MIELLPCPFCGMKPPEDLSDTLYPTGTWWRWGKDDWREYVGHQERKPGDKPMIRMHCTECMGGCGAEIVGHTNEEAAAKWNRRTLFGIEAYRPPPPNTIKGLNDELATD